ncbi:hypothetical protein [Prosthecobacter sp.]|uniref:hypothetical protein n=1 Tax=Prosthecobacter sp. TaxID=1965333 RepID=UPI0037848EEB
MSEDQRKHLEFIQAVITRMAGNSFLIRGWSVTRVSALVALAAKDSQKEFAILSLIPCAMFWFLDAYYLSLERRFRSLYNEVRQACSTDYSMTLPDITAAERWLTVLHSRTVLPFHGTMVAAILIAFLYIKTI